MPLALLFPSNLQCLGLAHSQASLPQWQWLKQMKGWLLLGSSLLGQAACLPPRGFPGMLEDLPGGTAATVFKESSLLPQPSLSGVWTGSTAATILLSAFMELHTCKRVSANSASSLASSLFIFFYTWSRRSPGSLRRKRC